MKISFVQDNFERISTNIFEDICIYRTRVYKETRATSFIWSIWTNLQVQFTRAQHSFLLKTNYVWTPACYQFVCANYIEQTLGCFCFFTVLFSASLSLSLFLFLFLLPFNYFYFYLFLSLPLSFFVFPPLFVFSKERSFLSLLREKEIGGETTRNRYKHSPIPKIHVYIPLLDSPFLSFFLSPRFRKRISFIRAHTGSTLSVENRTLRALLFERQHRVVVVVEWSARRIEENFISSPPPLFFL